MTGVSPINEYVCVPNRPHPIVNHCHGSLLLCDSLNPTVTSLCSDYILRHLIDRYQVSTFC